MITEGQYLDALKIVRDYIRQITIELDKKPYKNEFLNTKIRDYSGISVRTYNCLHSGINYEHDWLTFTFGDLQKLGKKRVRKFRNLGRKSIIELEKIYEDNNELFR
jgi:hypothetical protein